MDLKIKKDFMSSVVGFNNSALPLGERTDLIILADMAVRSGDQSLLDVFEKVPTLKELEKAKTVKLLADTKNPAIQDDAAIQTNSEETSTV